MWMQAVVRRRFFVVYRNFERVFAAKNRILTCLVIILMLPVVNGEARAGLKPLIVENDRGGSIVDRAREIEDLRASGQPVEIRGSVCFSTCTMLLGLAQTCIFPHTIFGFHGPSRSGKPLIADEFEQYSQLIAKHYPKPLKDWFLKKGRRRIKGLYKIVGAKIIRMGVKAC